MINPRFCRKCGTGLPADSQFCPSCGTAQQTTGGTATNTPSQPEPTGTGRLPAGLVLRNRYRLLEKVGQGGMGAVYIAQDTQLGDRLVAVKEMSMSRQAPQEVPLAVELFKREAHLLASLHHINLPVIYDHFGEQERWYLVMSFIQGSTLQAYIDNVPGKKLPVKDVVQIAIELCNVLDYLHNHQPQIIFRDLKPLNIMITPQKQIYLIDFGIARHFKQDQTKDTVYYYSVGYAPPEQYGQSQTGPRSDIYSLGATLHQMLSGQNPSSKPFHFASLQLLDPTIPVALAKLVAQMLEMSEQLRPASMVAVKVELEKILDPPKIAETQPADDRQKKEEKTENVQKETREKASLEDTEIDLTWMQIWKKSLVFLKKGWKGDSPAFFWKRSTYIGFWIPFSILCLILGIAGGAAILDRPFATWTYIAGIGSALVGMVFLFTRRWRWVSIVGGLLLVVFSSLVLISIYGPYNISCSSSTYTSGEYYYYSCYIQNSTLISQTIIPLSLLIFIVGGSVCIRKMNSYLRMFSCIVILTIGIVMSTKGIIYSNYYDQDGYHNYIHFPFAWIWAIQIILGGLFFLVTLSMFIFRVSRNSIRSRRRR